MLTFSSARASARSPTIAEHSALRTTRRGSRTLRPSRSTPTSLSAREATSRTRKPPTGWRLAPAFDLNPNTERADHVLNIDESDNRPSLATVIETSEWYVGSKDRGRVVVTEILHETRRWRQAAQALKIARADIELTATAFAESDVGDPIQPAKA